VGSSVLLHAIRPKASALTANIDATRVALEVTPMVWTVGWLISVVCIKNLLADKDMAEL
jgi:hypothetical protein